MKKKSVFGGAKLDRRWLASLVLVLAVVLSACGGATQTATMTEAPAQEMMEPTPTEAMMEPTHESMMEATEEPMMEDGTQEPMMDSTAEPMMEDESMGETSSSGDMMAPSWFSATLDNVNSGQSFTIQDLRGKVVLVETMAVWCTNCLAQQRQVKALHELLGARDDFISLGLDIDPNENADDLKGFVDRNGFDWSYAVAPAEVARELGNLYGAQFLNPPSTPMLIVDRHGEVHPLPFGIKDAQTLKDALDPFLSDNM